MGGSAELSPPARLAIESAGSGNNFVSIARLWEMAEKISVGKPGLKVPFTQIKKLLSANGFVLLPVTFENNLTVSTLPLHHRDPFDRIIIAQAITNGLTVITADSHFPAYQINIV